MSTLDGSASTAVKAVSARAGPADKSAGATASDNASSDSQLESTTTNGPLCSAVTSKSGGKFNGSSGSVSSNAVNSSNHVTSVDRNLNGSRAKENIDNNKSGMISQEESYRVNLLSGQELLLPRRQILLRALREYAEKERAGQKKRILEEVEEIGWKVAQANEGVCPAKQFLWFAKKRRDMAKEKDIRERAAKVNLALKNAGEAVSAAVVSECLFEIQKSKVHSEDGWEMAIREKDTGGSTTRESEDILIGNVGQRTPLAGKRKREHDDPVVAENPSKASKWDGSDATSSNKLLGDAEIDVDLGLVFNSPFRSDIDLQYDNSTEHTENIKPTSTKNSALIIATTILPFVFRAINAHRSQEGQVEVPLQELIFCINRETGDDFGAGDEIAESVLLGDVLTVGIRNFPELVFEKLLHPFHELSRVLILEELKAEMEKSVGGDDGRKLSGGSGSASASEIMFNNLDFIGNAVHNTDNAKKWWKVKGGDGEIISYSAGKAIKHVAFSLSLERRIDLPMPFGWEDGHELVPAFFNHHLPDLAAEQKDARIGFDLDVARVRVGSPAGHWVFPSEKAFIIAGFQMSDSGENVASWARLFPKFTCNLICCMKFFGDELKRSTMRCLRIMTDFTSSASAAALVAGPWCWPPAIPEVARFFDPMPLFSLAFAQNLVPTRPARLLFQDLFRRIRVEAINPAAPSSIVRAYWEMKKTVAWCRHQSQDKWVEAFVKWEASIKQSLEDCPNSKFFREMVLLYQHFREMGALDE